MTLINFQPDDSLHEDLEKRVLARPKIRSEVTDGQIAVSETVSVIRFGHSHPVAKVVVQHRRVDDGHLWDELGKSPGM